MKTRQVEVRKNKSNHISQTVIMITRKRTRRTVIYIIQKKQYSKRKIKRIIIFINMKYQNLIFENATKTDSYFPTNLT